MPVRQYQIIQEDTLQRIAQRELADASKWWSIAVLNRLDWPFINTDITPQERDASGKNVKILGDVITLPIPTGDGADLDQQFVAPIEDFYEFTFKNDLEMDDDGDLVINDETDDLRLVKGVENLVKALRRRLLTFLGELIYHPRYGSNIHLIPGEQNDARVIQLARIESVQSLIQDERVLELSSVIAEMIDDSLSIGATFLVQGAPDSDALEANFTFNR